MADWAKIKAEYMAGATPSKIAPKFKINYKTLTDRIHKEGWSAQRKKKAEKVQEKILDKYTNEIADMQIKCKRDQTTDAKMIIRKTIAAISSRKWETEDPVKYRSLVQSAETGYKLLRQALDIPDRMDIPTFPGGRITVEWPDPNQKSE